MHELSKNHHEAIFKCRSLSEPGPRSCRGCSRGQLDYVAVGAHAQASASLHLLRSANGCWCSTKPCLDRCATTPSDKHMQGDGGPSAKAGRGGHFYQPSRPLSLTNATNLDYESSHQLCLRSSSMFSAGYQHGSRASCSPQGTDSPK
jgi:hypothetical protein